MPRHCYHATPLLSCHATAIMPRHCYHATPLLSCHATAIMPRHCYHATPLLSCHATAIMPRHCYHATPLLSCHATAIMSRHCYHVTPLLSCHATAIMPRHCYHATPLLSCHATAIMPRLMLPPWLLSPVAALPPPQANVYHATVDRPSALHMPAALGIGGNREGAGVQQGGEGQLVKELAVKELAVKVYKTSILVFKDRERYVAGDYRFRHGYSKHNPRKMVKVWAEKEFRNLNRLRAAGVTCPVPLMLRMHVLVMSFIGTEGWGAPRLKDVQLSEGRWRECYGQVVVAMWRMYRLCRLVHGDLSEYNLLYLQGRVWVIDVSQSVDLDHPRALDFLREDCLHVTGFFRRKGMAVLTVRELFDFVTDPVMPESLVDDCLHKLQERAASRPLEQTAQEAIAEAVFLQSFIPQSLDQVKDAEKDIRRITSATKAAAQQHAAAQPGGDAPSSTQQGAAQGRGGEQGAAVGAAADAAASSSSSAAAAPSSEAPPLEGIFYRSLLGLKEDLSGVRTLPDILQSAEGRGVEEAGQSGGKECEESPGVVRPGGEGVEGGERNESERGGEGMVPRDLRGGAEGMEGGEEQQSEEGSEDGSEEGSDFSEDEGGEEEGGRRGREGAVSKEEVRAARKENKKKVKEEKRVARLTKVPKAAKKKKQKAAQSKKR
ncbi:unnamed protein product [Closterium sp. NIES-64]|nr:unnamed protein product [Closterium sp. NIES-64]